MLLCSAQIPPHLNYNPQRQPMLALWLALFLSLLLPQSAMAQGENAALRSQLFGDADARLAAATTANAAQFAPASFAQGIKHYRTAEKNLERKRSIEKIKAGLAKASTQLEQASAIAVAAREMLSAAIQARDDAAAAEALNFAAREWNKAEKQFASAIQKHEAGREDIAAKRASGAESGYRAAELVAIKNHYLAEARRLINDADKQKVPKYAPRTLADARQLLGRAETELNQNRYDTDQARLLARRAKVQAGHAFYLMGEIKSLRNGELSTEDFALKSEQPLHQLATALDMRIDLDQGPAAPTAEMTESVMQLRADSIELAELKQEVAEMEVEMRLLNKKLGLQSSRLMRQAEIKQKITLLESMFAFNEARVYRQGGNLLLRMVGLNFKSGQAVIQAKHFSLLTKLITALKQFPDAAVSVEGHTDAFGSDAVNLQLSQDRADAVAAYLKANMGESFFKDIRAVGYGETRPVANNETADGRKINRRIDLLIQPQF